MELAIGILAFILICRISVRKHKSCEKCEKKEEVVYYGGMPADKITKKSDRITFGLDDN